MAINSPIRLEWKSSERESHVMRVSAMGQAVLSHWVETFALGTWHVVYGSYCPKVDQISSCDQVAKEKSAIFRQ